MCQQTNNRLTFFFWLLFTLMVVAASGELLHDVRNTAQRSANATNTQLSNL